MEEIWIFDRLPAKFCGMVEEYRLELAKRSPIELDLGVSLAWITICWIHETVLISKKFWFINRLVEKDKIDLDKVCNNENYYSVDVWDNTDELIMLLAISDTPIDDLISYLK